MLLTQSLTQKVLTDSSLAFTECIQPLCDDDYERRSMPKIEFDPKAVMYSVSDTRHGLRSAIGNKTQLTRCQSE